MTIHRGDILRQILKDKEALKKLPKQIGSEAELFFKRGFQKQAWQGDNGDEPWMKRKKGMNQGPNILIGKGTANLFKGIRKQVSGNYIAVKVTGVASRYADIHNFGGTVKVPVTPKLRKFAWAMYFKAAGARERGATKTRGTSSTWTLTAGNEVMMWKFIAITKHPFLNIKIPKRQFIGQTKQLDKVINDMIERQFKPIK